GTDVGDLTVTGTGPTTITWLSRPQPPGTSGYDLFSATSNSASPMDNWLAAPVVGQPRNLGASGVCVQSNIAQGALNTTITGTDSRANPAAGQAYLYRVGHSSAFAGAKDPLGVFNGPLVMANVTCP